MAETKRQSENQEDTCAQSYELKQQGMELPPALVSPEAPVECEEGPKPSLRGVVFACREAGTQLQVKCPREKVWFLDGLVIEKLAEESFRDGKKREKASMKVFYNRGTSSRWLERQHHDQFRLFQFGEKTPTLTMAPGIPGTFVTGGHEGQNLFGKVHKRQNLSGEVYVEARSGMMQWWGTREQAVDGKPSQGHLQLSQACVYHDTSGRRFELRQESGIETFFGEKHSRLMLSVFPSMSILQCWSDLLKREAGKYIEIESVDQWNEFWVR